MIYDLLFVFIYYYFLFTLVGVGAGMYVDATQEPWSVGYKMYSYVTSELPALIQQLFPFVDTSRQSIFGHSMGGTRSLSLSFDYLLVFIIT